MPKSGSQYFWGVGAMIMHGIQAFMLVSLAVPDLKVWSVLFVVPALLGVYLTGAGCSRAYCEGMDSARAIWTKVYG